MADPTSSPDGGPHLRPRWFVPLRRVIIAGFLVLVAHRALTVVSPAYAHDTFYIGDGTSKATGEPSVTLQNEVRQSKRYLDLFTTYERGSPYTLNLAFDLPVETHVTHIVIRRVVVHGARGDVKTVTNVEVPVVDGERTSPGPQTRVKGAIHADPTPFEADDDELTVDGDVLFVAPDGERELRYSQRFRRSEKRHFMTML